MVHQLDRTQGPKLLSVVVYIMEVGEDVVEIVLGVMPDTGILVGGRR